MKRFLTVVVCFAMMLSLVLVGCGQTGNSEQTTTAATVSAATTQAVTEDDSIVTPAGTFPIVKPGNDITLKIFTSTRPGCDDFVNNPYTKLVEETMGIKLEFDVAEESESRQKLNILIASGDYPEIITGFLKPTNFSLAEQTAYAKQGILIPLNDMINKYSVGYKQILEQYPEVKEQFTLDDGKIYTMPEINECEFCVISQKMFVYQPWLDKLGLSEPTTTEEFYNVLKSFKTQDPNGNGKADEIPLAGATNGWNSKPHVYLMNSFIYADGNLNLLIKDGKVTAAFDKPEWKEGLKYMRKLVEEGLMAPESYTQKVDQLKLQAINGTIGAIPSAYQGNFSDTAKPDGDWTKYSILAPLKGPAGVQYASYNAYGNAQVKSFITDKCKNPEVAFRFLDSFYINDGSNPISLMKYLGGEEGVMWRKAKDGELGADGKPAKYAKTDAGNVTAEKNVWWDQIEPALTTAEMRVQWAQLPGANPMESILYHGTKKMVPFKPELSMLVPPLIFTEEQAVEVGELSATIKTYVDEALIRFIASDVNIDTEWDKYTAELKKMSLDRFLEIHQAAYDKKKGK